MDPASRPSVDHMRVLSELSGDVVAALLDDDEGTAPATDPYSDALRRFRDDGHPHERTRPWRRADPVPAGGRVVHVLRRLARDLLSSVSQRPAEEAEPESEEPPSNVRAIGEPAAAPTLELAPDGTWRPSTSGVGSRERSDADHRPAYISTLGSRYPEPSRDSGSFTVLPTPPPDQ